ncbi:MAG: DNA cytosine methyltransferase [Solirubrobacteraceae bacterium]
MRTHAVRTPGAAGTSGAPKKPRRTPKRRPAGGSAGGCGPSRRRRQPGRVIDLFAGAGGWAQGLAMLGLSSLGIETDEWACATARAAGHDCLQADVTSLAPSALAPVWGLVGSPPCQAYSSAGNGLGRHDKPFVIACAHELAAGNDRRTERLAQCQDPRSLLTVEPLRYALALKPRWVALEQVPAVLELWSVFAALLAAHGYQTATGILSAERYGVPQTRKRAFLLASLDGPVELPTPTHRSYNPRRKEVPEDELTLLPWVSMAQALCWRPCDRVGFPRRNDTSSNRSTKTETGTQRARYHRPASTLTSSTRSRTRRPGVQTRRSGRGMQESFAPTCSPAPAVTTGVSRWQAHSVDVESDAEQPFAVLAAIDRGDSPLVVTQPLAERGASRREWAWRNGNQSNAAVRGSCELAPTVHFGHRANQVEWVPCAYEARQRGAQPRPIAAPAPTMLAVGLAKGAPVWAGKRPATTVACDRRVHPPGHKTNASDPPGRYEQRRGANAVRVTVQQAAILQGFPVDYPWQGPRTRQFLQIGNAVPPPLARAVLEQAAAVSTPRARRQKPVSTPANRLAEDPDELVAVARREHEPVAAWCLFSGGHDSTVLAHRCRDHYDALAFIDTGTALPGVVEFAGEFAAWLGKPLRVLSAGDAFATMVLGDLVWWARFIAAHDRDATLTIERQVARDTRRYGRRSGGELGQIPHGFPGPGAHGRAYNRLKERQIMRLLRESKSGYPRRSRVLLLSGIRRAESRRRARREAINRLPGKSAVFVAPLIDWSNDQMREYRRAHRLPESPAAALLHRSGECNCGAFAAAAGERAMLSALYPEFFARIEALERQAEAAGVRWCRWGGYDLHGNRAGEASTERPGLLCESCQARQHATVRARRQSRCAAGAPQ